MDKSKIYIIKSKNDSGNFAKKVCGVDLIFKDGFCETSNEKVVNFLKKTKSFLIKEK